MPTTPMAMRGLYRYMADAVVFADCFTGVTYPVVNNIVMEKRYLQVRKSSGDAVLLTFSAHFAVVPSMRRGEGGKKPGPEQCAISYESARPL
ncbi:hypothetical protein [Candidatus Symbiopectobacterium endolongispinus]|uniref:hypothetical protein n=1 Tax=Candidatus Symbiopectobacterium endolongispinus TaxID=2812664 RepID=UPI0020795553|nr:hypothetical protein [Candidatus Symbiopectobacterium endolongispinus]